MKIINHPLYTKYADAWERWRLIVEGGDEFIEEYLIRREAEEPSDYTRRKDISYNPAFSYSAVMDVKNSIHQRIASEVQRTGGSSTYQTIIQGLEGGIDLEGSTIESFIGRKVLKELLFMKKVGVFIDAPIQDSELKSGQIGHPYMYIFTAEQIKNWSENTLLLEEKSYKQNEDGLVEEEITRFRYLQANGTSVDVKYLNANGDQIDKDTNEKGNKSYKIDLPVIPFVLFELTESLLNNIDRYQIAHLNLVSADMNWVWRANVSVYVEQVDPKGRLAQTFDAEEGDAETEEAKRAN